MQLKHKVDGKFEPIALSLRDSLVIAAFILGGLILTYVLRTYFGKEADDKWGGLAINTVICFGYFVYTSQLFFRKVAFWVLATSCLAIHLVVFVVILTHVRVWKPIWFMSMLFELAVLFHLRDRSKFVQ